jgi:cytochrome P450
MAIEVRKARFSDTLRLQRFVSVPGFFQGLVAPNRWFLWLRCRLGAGQSTMHFFRDLREKYRCDHLWVWFPFGRTLLVFAPESMEAVLFSDANAADPFLKKYALSRFIPNALVISSGDEWRERRRFNEGALDTGKLHRYHDAFVEIVVRETQRLTHGRPDELRWPDFQSLGQRISHQAILGAGQIRPEMARRLARMVRLSNVMLRAWLSYWVFYGKIERYLRREESVGSTSCLIHRSTELAGAGGGRDPARVPAQIGFWFFVLKDALELHVARTLALIAAHPEVQARVRDEIRAAGTLTAQAIDGLGYLEACLMEQLRLWTPVPILLRRAVRSFSLRDEIPIEAGRQILIHTGFYHRDPGVFGGRANSFAPDAARSASAAALYVFSAHRQSCAGRSLATFVLKATLASLLQRSRFELRGPAVEPGRIPYLYDHFGVRLHPVPDA